MVTHRTMGTPDDTMWPGVTSLPDYKSSFPKWPKQKLQNVMKAVDPQGLDLLEVSPCVCVCVCGGGGGGGGGGGDYLVYVVH